VHYIHNTFYKLLFHQDLNLLLLFQSFLFSTWQNGYVLYNLLHLKSIQLICRLYQLKHLLLKLIRDLHLYFFFFLIVSLYLFVFVCIFVSVFISFASSSVNFSCSSINRITSSFRSFNCVAYSKVSSINLISTSSKPLVISLR